MSHVLQTQFLHYRFFNTEPPGKPIQLYINKLCDLEDMNKILKHTIFQDQWEENIKSEWINKGFETLMKILPINNTPGPDNLTAKSKNLQRFNTCPEILPKNQEGKPSKHSWWIWMSALPWYQNQTKTPHTKKENCRSTSLMSKDAKILNKILEN